MKLFLATFLLSICPLFANSHNNIPSSAIEKSGEQIAISTTILESYLNFGSNKRAFLKSIKKQRELYLNNIDLLFTEAENYGIDMIRMVGGELNKWAEFEEAITKLPYTEENIKKVIQLSKELSEKNNETMLSFKNKNSKLK